MAWAVNPWARRWGWGFWRGWGWALTRRRCTRSGSMASILWPSPMRWPASAPCSSPGRDRCYLIRSPIASPAIHPPTPWPIAPKRRSISGGNTMHCSGIATTWWKMALPATMSWKQPLKKCAGACIRSWPRQSRWNCRRAWRWGAKRLGI